MRQYQFQAKYLMEDLAVQPKLLAKAGGEETVEKAASFRFRYGSQGVSISETRYCQAKRGLTNTGERAAKPE